MKIEKLIRSNIRKLKPYSSARSKFLSGTLLDANENSYGSIIEDFTELNINRYPDPNHLKLRKELSKYTEVNLKNIFAGAGSDEIIDLLIRIFCEPRIDSAAILEPTYGMYKVACQINDVNVKSIELADDFQIDMQKTLRQLDERTKLLFVCSPNNPTGNSIDVSGIIKLSNKFPGIIVVDQAYFDFTEEPEELKRLSVKSNIVLLRTFSKAWGLAGIRLGYAIANEVIIDYLYKVKYPYNINSISSNLAIKALGNVVKKNRLVEKIIAERARLTDELNKIEKIERVFPSDANFILFRTGKSSEVFEHLKNNGVIIRDRSSAKKLNNCLRVTVGTKEENDLFLNLLKLVLSK